MTGIAERLAFYPDKIEIYEVDDAAVNPHPRARPVVEDAAIAVDEVVQHTDSGSGASQMAPWPANVSEPKPPLP